MGLRLKNLCLRALGCAVFLSTVGGATAETRLALVVTNQDYPLEIGTLANPHNDGAAIAAALQSVGFAKTDIAVLKDADQPALRLAVADFVERIEKAGPEAVAFFYYSGHGAADRTERGENYLIPVGARITLARQLPILGVSLTEITKSLERVPARARFVVIDACRNVAFTKGLKDATKGFVPERKLDGMIVAFATRPGETADDDNVYAATLAGILPTPGLRAEEVFKETQLKVAELNRGRQVPWTEDGLLTRFRFKEPQAPPPTPLAPQAASPTTNPPLAMKQPPAEPPKPAPAANPAPSPAAPAPGFEHLPGTVLRACADCPEMVVVPAGRFTMGFPASEEGRSDDEGPQRTVTIAKPFAVGKFEVTFAEWDACVAAGGCKQKPADQGWGRDKRPVINVSWDDAKQYTAWLSKKTGQTYRLLTEAEWEYAARAGTSTPFSTGKTITTDQANFDGNETYGGSSKGKYREKTIEVGSFKPNAFGLHDMHGNVWEWVEDCYADSYTGAPADGSAAKATSGCSRVLRGGSWFIFPQGLRSAFRIRAHPDDRGWDYGFRLARTLDPTP